MVSFHGDELASESVLFRIGVLLRDMICPAGDVELVGGALGVGLGIPCTGRVIFDLDFRSTRLDW